MFVENFSKFIKYYGKGRKLKLFCFLILSLIVGLLELSGIAIIYPFILLIITPQSILHTKYYSYFVAFTHVHNVLINAFILGGMVVFLFIAKNLTMIVILYLQTRFVTNWKRVISEKFMHYYIYSTYKDSLKTTPSMKIYNSTFLVGQALDGFIFRAITLLTNATIVIMILGLLFIKFMFAAILASGFIIFSMTVHNKLFKAKVAKISQKLLKLSKDYNDKLMENINNLKEIKILSAEDYFYNDYIKMQKKCMDITFKSSMYGSIPPYIIEILVVMSLFILAVIISIQNIENPSWMIASYAIVAASIFRIAPALNRIQTSINNIDSSRNFVKTMITEYESSNFDFMEEKPDVEIEFKDSIKLQDIYFAYKKDAVIKGLNLEIKKGMFYGIIGVSGAGKSTLADILMGLLPVDNGEIYLDDLLLDPKYFCLLRKLISYVPQQINILDGSFKRNVAWGIQEKEIDEIRVIDSLKKAQLYDFVLSFEEGINAKAIVGSTGLSQGQKQRLAIARALYRDSEILIFDEATSSLDVETEHEITKMLNSLKGQKTIIAIAHRLSTLKSCDSLIYLKQGEIIDMGTFEQLSAKYPEFEKLIKLSNINNV